MHQPSDQTGATSRYALTVDEARAQLVHGAILEHRERVAVIEDVARLPTLTGWTSAIRDAAIAQLVADGQLAESASGKLIVQVRAGGGQ